jgi:hypothetical protein
MEGGREGKRGSGKARSSGIDTAGQNRVGVTVAAIDAAGMLQPRAAVPHCSYMYAIWRQRRAAACSLASSAGELCLPPTRVCGRGMLQPRAALLYKALARAACALRALHAAHSRMHIGVGERAGTPIPGML